MQRLLMIDDDARLGTMVRDYLAASGFDVEVAGSITNGVAALRARPAELLILDLMLPDGDGLDVCRRLRADGVGIPILMLTAKGDPIDRVIGLEIGADDYLPKPFEPRELQARIKALLRRAGSGSADSTLRFGRLEIDRDARLVRIDGQARPLTSHQFELLVALAERAGRVLTREQLMDLVRGEALEAFDRSIDVHIARIRAAIEDDPRHPTRIVTVRGAGYVFARSQDVA
ncbi:MAG TPA: response regulator transcription factor [Burkholderiaceae bacterium]|nr:response regulator transcription factor [Burkholderiaceae bacterium]HQR75425.1 response regulator transcription factor [Burkholderiaceae bacterium]